MPTLYELNKVQLQERFMFITQDSIGCQKMPCVNVLSLSGGVESEWKRFGSPPSVGKKMYSSMNLALGLFRFCCTNPRNSYSTHFKCFGSFQEPCPPDNCDCDCMEWRCSVCQFKVDFSTEPCCYHVLYLIKCVFFF